uniref:Uncharacterized protein n=2 Tax=Phaeomonas parva TaxID=124430 RepID=A0A7S1UFN5_9STRA|mmetsp:Transcript_46010/g.143977  ORF Transcript_46010/g.143977 Transcript_46010/m.143977 type:complete len:396 (+) Transcript_46010:32-1219(+)
MTYHMPFLLDMDLDSVVLNQVFTYFHSGSLVGVVDPVTQEAARKLKAAREKTTLVRYYDDVYADPPPPHRVIWSWQERVLARPSAQGAAFDFVRFCVFFKNKVLSLVAALFALFIMSNTTAMLVRHLIASGVALVIPMLAFMQSFCGMRIDERVVAASYPWLVLPMRQMRQPWLIVAGHLGFLVVMYIMYEASQVLWANWLYPRLVANGTYLWLFALIMVLEYYSMVFLRSKAAIGFAPRMLMLSLLCYHLYIYSFPFGFYRPVLLLLTSVCVNVCLYCCVHLERQAVISGEVSFEQPRGAFVRLPYPIWQADLPPLWTVFVPPNETSTNVYNMPVPRAGGRPTPGDAGAGVGRDGSGEAQTDPVESADQPIPASDSGAGDARVRSRIQRGAERV